MADVQFNPMDPAFVADPYPTYHRLRAEDPVHHSPLGFWVLTRYPDVMTMLRDPRLIKEPIAAFVAARFGMAVPPPGLGLSMLDRDPPDHTRLRGLVSKAFTPKALESLRPRHPEDRGRSAGRRRREGPDGPDRGVRVPAPGPGDLRDAGRPGEGPRALQGLGPRHRPRPGRDHAAARLRGGPAQHHRPPGPGRVLPRADRGAARGPARRHALRPHRGRGGRRQAQRRRAPRHLHPAPGRGPRDHREPDRQRHAGAAAPSRPAPEAPREPRPHRHRGGGAAALRRARAAHRAHPERGHHDRRPDHSQGRDGDAVPGRGRPRPRPVPRSGPPRHHARRQPAHRLRHGHPLLPGRAARAHGGADRDQHAAARGCRSWPWPPTSPSSARA